MFNFIKQLAYICIMCCVLCGCGGTWDYNGSYLLCYRPAGLTDPGYVVEYQLLYDVTTLVIIIKEPHQDWHEFMSFTRPEVAMDFMYKLIDVCESLGGIVEYEFYDD